MQLFNRYPMAVSHLAESIYLLQGPVWCLLLFWLGVTMPIWQSELLPIQGLIIISAVLAALAVRVRLLLGSVFLIAGLSWATWAFQQHRDNHLPKSVERQSIMVTGSVVDLPSVQEGNSRFRFEVSAVPRPELSSLIGQVIQLSCYRCPYVIKPGDQWGFTVRLKRPRGYASWGAFDYEKFLFRHRIVARGYVRTKDENLRLKESSLSVHRWRLSVRAQLDALLPDTDAGAAMISALTIGDKSGFSKRQRTVFQESGVSHLMAISGLHIGLVFACISVLMKWLLWPVARIFDTLPRQWLVFAPGLLAATAYAALAGFAISTQRALLMLFVYVAAKLWARNLSLLHVLLIAVFLLLLYDPFSVLDIGFWLSCGAVVIIAFASTRQARLSLIRLQPTLWLGMLPMSVLFFGQVSLLSPLVNLIAVPLFCLLLIPLTLIGLVLSQLGLDTLASSLLLLMSLGFNQVYLALEWVTALPLARWYTRPFSLWQWCLLALAISVSYLGFRVRYVLWGAFLGSVFCATAPKIDSNELRLVLLDVGQGLAMVIETADRVMVYDTGPKYGSGFTAAEAVLLPYLRQRGVRKIDKLIISHADNDHIGGYSAVANAFDISETITSRPDKIAGATRCAAGQSWRYGATRFEIISPADATPSGSNNHSCVIAIEHFATRLLISGDIEKQVERFLLKQSAAGIAKLKAEIMLVPHQGSKTSSTAEFLDAVQPQLALVAAGYLNHYGHPHEQVMQRYRERETKIHSTIDDGSILILIDGDGWRTSSYRHSQQRFWHYQKVSNQSR